MKSYGSFCPICGKRNEGLMLEETDGWMECIHCQQDVRLIVQTLHLPAHRVWQTEDCVPDAAGKLLLDRSAKLCDTCAGFRGNCNGPFSVRQVLFRFMRRAGFSEHDLPLEADIPVRQIEIAAFAVVQTEK